MLAESAGQDATDAVTALYALHEKGEARAGVVVRTHLRFFLTIA